MPGGRAPAAGLRRFRGDHHRDQRSRSRKCHSQASMARLGGIDAACDGYPAPAMSAPDTTELHAALAALRGAVDAAVPRLPDPDTASERDARRRRLAWHLDEYLLPRVMDLDAPLVAVLIGSTGAGKSSLANGLAGRRVSPSGGTRPTTRRPAVLVAPGDVEAFMAGRVLGRLAGDDRLDMVVSGDAAPGLALVDAPDVDSVEAANRQT